MNAFKISKRKARKAFNNGEDVWLTPSNFPFDHNADRINIANFTEEDKGFGTTEDFDDIVESYKFHNCDGVRGRHVHYYLK